MGFFFFRQVLRLRLEPRRADKIETLDRLMPVLADLHGEFARRDHGAGIGGDDEACLLEQFAAQRRLIGLAFLQHAAGRGPEVMMAERKEMRREAAGVSHQQRRTRRIDDQTARGLPARQGEAVPWRGDFGAAVRMRPVDERPAPILIGDPVRRRVEHGMLALLFEPLPGREPPGDVQHAGVRDDQHAASFVVLRDVGQRRRHAGAEFVQRLAVWRREVRLAGEIVGVDVGVGHLHFGVGVALPDAVVLFAQPRRRLDGEAALANDRFRGGFGAAQIARIGAVEMRRRKLARERLRLGSAAGVESDVELALKAPFDIPVGLAVTRETQKRAGHVVSDLARQGGRSICAADV